MSWKLSVKWEFGVDSFLTWTVLRLSIVALVSAWYVLVSKILFSGKELLLGK